MTNKPLDYTSQLLLLKDLTQRFESLHQAQELQLALWPTVCVDAGYNYLENKPSANMFKAVFGTKTVVYEWTGTFPTLDKKYISRLKELHNNIKWLLGDDWQLQILFNGIAIYPIRENANRISKKRRSSSGRKLVKRRRKSRT